jgi:hypothetical protein
VIPSHGVDVSSTTGTLQENPWVDRQIVVPADPAVASWNDQLAWPSDGRGTITIVSHINFIINGENKPGVFNDLGTYKAGQIADLFLSDGEEWIFQAGLCSSPTPDPHSKTELAAEPSLWNTLLDFQTRYSCAGSIPGTRLLAVSCGGQLNEVTSANGNLIGDYSDNIFVFFYRIR